MPQTQLRTAGIALLIVCLILVFVGWQQYEANAESVNAMNQIGHGMAMGMGFGASSPLGGVQLQPGTPATTTYAIFFAALTGIGGVVCLLKAK